MSDQIEADKEVIKILFLALCLATNKGVKMRLAQLLAAEAHHLLVMLERGDKNV